MDRTDSSQAMQSLLTYAESESDSDDEAADPTSASANTDTSDAKHDPSTAKSNLVTKTAKESEIAKAEPTEPKTLNEILTKNIPSSEIENTKTAEPASPKRDSVVVPAVADTSPIDRGSSPKPPITEKPSATSSTSETTVVEEISMQVVINPAPATEDPEKGVEVDESSVLTGQIDDSDEEPEEKSAATLRILESKAFTIDLDTNSNQASPVDVLNINQKPAVPRPLTATKLVSYGMEELDAEDDDDDEMGMEATAPSEVGASAAGEVGSAGEVGGAPTSAGAAPATPEESERAKAARARSALIPPPPPGHCSKRLQEKLLPFFAKRFREGVDLNHRIQNKKEFRNPSIYEKLILFCGIDENGSNYPRGVFNPHAWRTDEYYDELARAQKVDMDKREAAKKDRKKVEFISGVVKKAVVPPAPVAAPAAAAAAQAPAAKKRSKWDQEPKT